MHPGADLVTGLLLLSKLENGLADDDVVKNIDFPITHGSYKIGDFLKIITDSNLHRYKFTNDGIGCRYWTRIVLKAWHDNRLIHNIDVQPALDAMCKLWPAETPAAEIAQGTFY